MVFPKRRQQAVDKKDVVMAALYFIQQHYKYAIMTQLNKILTIAQEESGTKVFEITPDKYGPRVVNLYNTLDELKEEGLVSMEKVSRQYSEHGYPYMIKIQLTPQGMKEAERAIRRLMRAGKGALVGVLEGWADASYKTLIYYIYKVYPKYITKSIIADKVEKQEF